jgi:cell division protein ZapB
MDNPSFVEKLEKLEASVQQLLVRCEKLTDENDAYKTSNNSLMLERSDLLSKNDKVRGQVEAMIDRLKAAEG